MALITCPECGEQISDKARICPKCGLPLKLDTVRHSECTEKRGNTRRWKAIVGIVAGVTVCATIILGIMISGVFSNSSDSDNIAGSKKDNTINGHEYVDLGLSSGLLWATCNVGATMPEEYGEYYAWGETVSKSKYMSETYKFADESNHYLCTESPSVLPPNYDVASVCWSGEWRMPTFEEFNELANDCKWEWVTLNGHNGYKITGSNGNSIFLPAAGSREMYAYVGCGGSFEYADDDYAGVKGKYWSSTINCIDNTRACALSFDSSFYKIQNRGGGEFRYIGYTIRPVIMLKKD